MDDKFFREVQANCWDPRVRIDECDAFHVHAQVLSTVPVMFSEWARPHHALELHQALNAHMAQTCRDFPRHYAGIGTLPLQSPQLAIRELERCMDELKLESLTLHEEPLPLLRTVGRLADRIAALDREPRANQDGGRRADAERRLREAL